MANYSPALNEGFAAYRLFNGLGINPYTNLTFEFSAWQRGHIAAETEARYGMVSTHLKQQPEQPVE